MVYVDEIKLTSEIICFVCADQEAGKISDTGSGRHDVCIRYDCRMLTDKCVCLKLEKEGKDKSDCKCCRVCKYIKTKPTSNYMFEVHYDKPEPFSSNKCGRCKEPVFHHFYYSTNHNARVLKDLCDNSQSKSSENAEEDSDKTQLRRSSSSSSIVSTISVDSECSLDEFCKQNDYDIYLNRHNTSIQKIHLNAVESFLLIRSRGDEYISDKRDNCALAQGHTLSEEQINELWGKYIMHNK
jgi:hypothetical protein